MNQKELLIISIMIFLTVIGWITADLHHVSQTQKITEINQRFSRPFRVKVDKEIFTTLERRR